MTYFSPLSTQGAKIYPTFKKRILMGLDNLQAFKENMSTFQRSAYIGLGKNNLTVVRFSGLCPTNLHLRNFVLRLIGQWHFRLALTN